MEKNVPKTTLIIDGNWLMMSRFFVNKDKFTIDEFSSESINEEKFKNARKELANQLANSISVNLARFNNQITNVILVSDNGSWRKKLDIPDINIKQEKYKGNRKKDSNVAWEYVYGALDELRDGFKEIGLTISNAHDIEGDDWCMYWAKKLNDEGINAIIWSVDADLKQLVSFNDVAYTIWQQKEQIVAPICMYEDDSTFESMFKPTIYCPSFERYKDNFKVDYINVNDIIIEKIFCGDSSDNIFGIIRRSKGSKTFKMTKKMLEKVLEELKITTLKECEEQLDNIWNTFFKQKPSFKNDLIVTKEQFKNHFFYNKQLVLLKMEMLPDYLYEEFAKSDYKEIENINEVINNYTKLLSNEEKNTILNNIIENTDLPF